MSEQDTADVASDLVAAAQRQLDEHKLWLESEILKIKVGGHVPDALMALLVRDIKLRVAKTSGRVVSVVYEYPDELYRFLVSDLAPKRLRDSLAGGHVVDPGRPAFTAEREP